MTVRIPYLQSKANYYATKSIQQHAAELATEDGYIRENASNKEKL